MRDADNIREVEALGIDLMGFIFWNGSKRFVCHKPTYLPTHCQRVGVFVNEDIEQVKRLVEEYALDYIQLHGHESPAYINQLKYSLSIGCSPAFYPSGSPSHLPFSWGGVGELSEGQKNSIGCSPYQGELSKGLRGSLSIIKAFNIADPSDFEQTKAYEGAAHFFLFDTKGKSVGGNGEQFDWNILDNYNGNTPFILSGGIGPDDASRIMAFKHPKCIGIDLNSRFEITPGLKDINKLKTFIQTIKNDEQD